MSSISDQASDREHEDLLRVTDKKHQRTQRRQVLSEEAYTSGLSTVIQRNYFPSLPQLQTQMTIQMARDEATDIGTVIAIRRSARKLQQQEENAVAEDELDENDQTEQGLRKKPRLLEHESLTNFHLRVTSEDNAEYETLQQHEINARKQKLLRSTQQAMSLLTSEGKSLSAQHNARQSKKQTRTPLILASDEFNPSPHRHILTLRETEKQSQAENPLFAVPETRSNMHSTRERPLLGWKGSFANNSTARNSKVIEGVKLSSMPPPTSRRPSEACRRATLNRSLSRCNAKGSVLLAAPIQYIPKEKLEKKIVPSATRFPEQDSPSSIGVGSRRRGAPVAESLQDGLDSDGYSTTTTTDYTSDSTDLDAPPRHSLQKEREQAARLRRNEQSRLVAMTPVIIPGRECEVDEPIMTWGEVNSTPIVISQREKTKTKLSVPGPVFNLAEETTREAAASKALSVLQARGRRAKEASTPVRHDRIGSRLTASAKNKHKIATPVRSSAAFGTALRASYARSSSRPTSASRSRSQAHRTAHSATPVFLPKPTSTNV